MVELIFHIIGPNFRKREDLSFHFTAACSVCLIENKGDILIEEMSILIRVCPGDLQVSYRILSIVKDQFHFIDLYRVVLI